MAKQKFVGEYPINASRKMLFPYLSTATGLCQWFADDVNINNIDKFLNDDEKPKENDTLEFRLEINELTQEVFVRVEEYTESEDMDESYQIWDNLLAQLKEIIGA